MAAPLALSCGGWDTIQQQQQELDTWLEWSNYWYFRGQNDYDAYARSMRLATRALEKDPNNIMAKNILGYCMLKLGPWDSDNERMTTARKVFTELIAMEPTNYRAHMGLGICYYKLASADRDSEGKPGYGRLLGVFDRALESLTAQQEKMTEVRGFPERSTERLAGENTLAEANAEFGSDIRALIARRYFPLDLYIGIANTDDDRDVRGLPGGDPPDGTDDVDDIVPTDRGPRYSEIQEALANRIDGLLDAQALAIKQVPSDLATFEVNLSRLETLLRVARQHFRASYLEHIEMALEEFDECERLDPSGSFFWVFEYRWYTQRLLGTLYDPVTHRDEHWSSYQKACVAAAKYLRADIRYESRRLARLSDERIAQMEDNPWFQAPVDDYRVVMHELMNMAKVGRQGIIADYVSLLAVKFHDYQKALYWADQHERAEILFDSAVEPYRYHFLRGQVYHSNRLYEEGRYEIAFGHIVPSGVPEYDDADRDRARDVPTSGDGDDDSSEERPLTKDEHEVLIYELARLAYREFSLYMKRSSAAIDGEPRSLALGMMEQLERFYPGIESDAAPDTGW